MGSHEREQALHELDEIEGLRRRTAGPQGVELAETPGEPIELVVDREEVALVLMGIEGLSFRYYSEGRRAELLRLQPVLLQVFLRALA